MTEKIFGIPLAASLMVHGLVLMIVSVTIHNSNLRRQDFLPIGLVDLPRTETPPPIRQADAPPEVKQPPPAPKVEKRKETPQQLKNEVAKLERPAPSTLTPTKKEPVEAAETKPSLPAKAETPVTASTARVEGGGSEAGAENLFTNDDVRLVPGSGTTGGGGGTAAAGLGRGAGAPGLPAQTASLRANREAKPLQTVKANYPPMALRMGLEADVTLRIEVDPEGKVTYAAIIKGGGAGFDEEALKAVKQSRFEPAQKEGKEVAAEFTFIYRFQLQR